MADFNHTIRSYIYLSGSYSVTSDNDNVYINFSDVKEYCTASSFPVSSNPKVLLYALCDKTFDTSTVTDLSGSAMMQFVDNNNGARSGLYELGNSSIANKTFAGPASFTLTIPKLTYERTVTIYYGAAIQSTYMWDSIAGEYSFTQTIPSSYTAPSNSSRSISDIGTTSFKLSLSWTNGTESATAYCNLNPSTHKDQSMGTSSPASYTYTELTPNTNYNNVHAWLHDGSQYFVGDNPFSVHTLIAAPTSITASSTTTSITVDSVESDNKGSFYIEYSDDNSTWKTSNKFTGLTPNKKYTIYARCVSNTKGGISSSKSITIYTKIAAVTSSTASSTTTSITVDSVESDNNTGYKYQYIIYKNEKWQEWQDSNKFTGLSSNTKYWYKVRAVSDYSDAGTSDEKQFDLWTYPEINTLNVYLKSGSEHNTIEATASAKVSTSYDQYKFALDSTYKEWNTVGSWSGLSENTSYIIKVKMRNTTSGLESAEVSSSITTWYNPVTNLSINLVNRWFWYLEVNCSYTYNGTIEKYEFAIGDDEDWVDKGTSNKHSRGSTSPTDINKLTYNTDYVCWVRVTDNHGRQYSYNLKNADNAKKTFKTLDERPLYVNGTLREVKVIKSDGSVAYITPNLLNVVKSDGSVVNMNKIINNDSRTQYQ